MLGHAPTIYAFPNREPRALEHPKTSSIPLKANNLLVSAFVSIFCQILPRSPHRKSLIAAILAAAAKKMWCVSVRSPASVPFHHGKVEDGKNTNS
jgi:hypothetical protein